MEHALRYEQLPSGKVIARHLGEDGSVLEEQHTYGMLDIGIKYDFKAGVKIGETYFSKRRLVSQRSCEKARVAYPDMPRPRLCYFQSGGLTWSPRRGRGAG